MYTKKYNYMFFFFQIEDTLLLIECHLLMLTCKKVSKGYIESILFAFNAIWSGISELFFNYTK